MNLIAKPSKDNIKTYVPIGLSLVSLSFLDVFVNAFFNFNLLLCLIAVAGFVELISTTVDPLFKLSINSFEPITSSTALSSVNIVITTSLLETR